MNLKLIYKQLINKELYINLNLGWLIFYLFFICYGYFGALSFSRNDYIERPLFCIIFSSLILSSQIILGLISYKFSEYLEQKIFLKFKNIIIFLLLLIIHLLLCWSRINNDLSIDELSYAQSSHNQSIAIVGLAYKFLPYISLIKAKLLVQATSFLLFLSNLFLIYLTYRITWFYRIYIFTILLIISKLIYLSLGGYLFSHPPIQYISPFIFGSILGINNYAFRLAYFLPYIFFVSILFLKLKNNFNFLNSLLSVLSISTIPICLNASTIIEQSLWGLISISLYLLSYNFDEKLNLKKNAIQAAIFSLFRQSNAFIFVPLSINYLYLKNKYLKRDFVLFSISFLLFATFFLFSVLNGTPTSKHLSELNFIEKFSFIREIFNSNFVLRGIFQAVDYWWLFFFPFAFLKKELNANIKFNFSNLIFFSIIFIVFYSIPKEFWEYSKYKLEFIIPFCILGFYRFILFIKEIFPKNYSFLISFLSTSLIILNLNSDKSFLNLQYSSIYNIKNDINYKIQFNGFIKEPPPPYTEAFTYVKNKNITGKTFIFDTTYGNLNEIINGLNIRDLRESELIFQKYFDLKNKKKFKELSLALTKNEKIEGVLVPSSTTKNFNEFIDSLLDLNWTKKAEFIDWRYKTKITVFGRNN